MLQREFDLYLDRARHFYKRLADELFFETVPMEASSGIAPTRFRTRNGSRENTGRFAKGSAGAVRGTAAGSA